MEVTGRIDSLFGEQASQIREVLLPPRITGGWRRGYRGDDVFRASASSQSHTAPRGTRHRPDAGRKRLPSALGAGTDRPGTTSPDRVANRTRSARDLRRSLAAHGDFHELAEADRWRWPPSARHRPCAPPRSRALSARRWAAPGRDTPAGVRLPPRCRQSNCHRAAGLVDRAAGGTSAKTTGAPVPKRDDHLRLGLRIVPWMARRNCPSRDHARQADALPGELHLFGPPAVDRTAMPMGGPRSCCRRGAGHRATGWARARPGPRQPRGHPPRRRRAPSRRCRPGRR